MSHDPGPAPHVREDTHRLRRAFLLALAFAAALWWIKMLEALVPIDLISYGVYPRTLHGLPGVLTAPFIHGSLAHLISNTPPIVILGTALLYGYPHSARLVVPVVLLGTGLGVWLFGRESYHVGASGLATGVLFFILTIGVLRWDRRAIGLSLAVFFLYGGMIWGVFPGEPGISYESHLAGALIGVALAFLLRNRDPIPVKRYSWEDEVETSDERDVEARPPEGGAS
jgi:membrane associated rhomboid family serine protease